VDTTRSKSILTNSYWPADRGQPIQEVSIGDSLRTASEAWPDKIALAEGVSTQSPVRTWTYAALVKEAMQVAQSLLGLFRSGERVVIWAANSPEWVLIELGAALADVTLVTANPAYVITEIRHVLLQSNASGIFVQDEYRGINLGSIIEALRPDLKQLREVISLSSWSAFLAGHGNRELPHVASDAVAQIQYTSGTTGAAKGAQLTHRGLANNARFFAKTIGAGPEDVWINPMPMFHTAGSGLVTLGALQTGGKHVLPPAFDASLMLSLFEAQHGTLMLGVPTMLVRMLDSPDATLRDLSSWRQIALGGAPVSPLLVHRAEQEFGIKVSIGFGQTEASPYITHTLPDDPYAKWPSTVGRPLPQTEVKIIDPADGRTVPVGAVGELCVRGYGLMKGYLNDCNATTSALDADGWLHTGDLASMDGLGYCSIQGRLKDMIIRGGENIYPREIENLLASHPAVAEIYVVGIPEVEWGEVVAAFVRVKPGSSVSERDLDTFCREHLASYKMPRLWRFVTGFPQTASGKVQKFALREQFLQELKENQ
jgi:fatty-acyl-CoA synthase